MKDEGENDSETRLHNVRPTCEEAVRNKLYFLGKKDVSLQHVSFCLNSFLTAFSVRALEGHKYNPGEFWESRDDLEGRWRGANSRWWGRGRLAFPPSVISEQLLRPGPACSQRPSSATRLPRQPRREAVRPLLLPEHSTCKEKEPAGLEPREPTSPPGARSGWGVWSGRKRGPL